MYSTCLFCNAALGANDALENFQVGRRLAYDAATGRLWVVCSRCKRWNLSPIETRWEAIEEAERAFSGTRLRVSTDNIGMARLRDGTELVRIGAPQKPEFAAWRYGDQFLKRSRKYVAYMAGMSTVQLVPMLGQFFASHQFLSTTASLALSLAGAGGMVGFAAHMHYRRWHDRRRHIMVRDDNGAIMQLPVAAAGQSRIFPVGNGLEWQLMVPQVPVSAEGRDMPGGSKAPERQRLPAILSGRAAERALASILPHTNGIGSGRRTVNDAIDLASSASSLGDIMRGSNRARSQQSELFRLDANHRMIAYFPAHIRLAMEMAVHEEDERRAMEGELMELEQRWRDADEIARIADGMFLPERMNVQIEVMKTRGESAHDS